MNRMPRLSKSGIEYLDYAWNFYSGCDNKKLSICQVRNCWAEGITKRMRHNYPNGFKPTFYPEAFLSPLRLRKPSIIGCAFMGDLFGDWVEPEEKVHSIMPSGKASITMSLKGWIFTTIEQCPQHTFLFLTKCPQNLPRWSPFPDNCWVGVTATEQEYFIRAVSELRFIEAKIKYLSFEPLLGPIPMLPEALTLAGINWVIIGAQTKPYKPPEIEWVEEIHNVADKAGIPIFLKDNLFPLFKDKMGYLNKGWLRQEMPSSGAAE